MNNKVYLLDKDYQFIDSIQKRLQLDNDISLAGVSADAGAAHGEITREKPRYLIFGYPMNFKAVHLAEAMRVVSPDMILIAALDVGKEGFRAELQAAGIKHIFQKPTNNEEILSVITDDIKKRSNPYGNPFEQAAANENPFAQKSNENPFAQKESQVDKNPFTGGSFGQKQSQPSPFNEANYTPQETNPFNQGNQGGFNSNLPSSPAQQYGDSNIYNQNQSSQYTEPNQSFKTIKQNIVAIHCPKGGVGKTSVSTNTAALLSTAKIGKQPLKVLLIDMDWEFGDVCVNMGLKPHTNVMKWVNEIESRRAQGQNLNFTEAQIDKFLIKYKTGLHILAAPANHNDVVNIPSDAAEIIIRNLKENTNYDVIIFDCGNNTENYTLHALLSAHTVYEVITMDVSAMNDLSMLLSTLRSISFPMDKIKLIMNRVPRIKGEADYSLEEISQALGGLPIAVKIPDYEKVRTHNNKGEPLVLSRNTNPFTEAIMQTANEIMGNNLFTSKKKRRGSGDSGGQGFFGRLFGR